MVTTPSVAPAVNAHYRCVEVSVTQPGPAASGLLALAHVLPQDPIVFIDCDSVYSYPQELRAAPVGRAFVMAAMLAAFSSAPRVTLVGSMIPALTMSTYSPVATL